MTDLIIYPDRHHVKNFENKLFELTSPCCHTFSSPVTSLLLVYSSTYNTSHLMSANNYRCRSKSFYCLAFAILGLKMSHWSSQHIWQSGAAGERFWFPTVAIEYKSDSNFVYHAQKRLTGIVVLYLWIAIYHKTPIRYKNLPHLALEILSVGNWVELSGTLAGKLSWKSIVSPTFVPTVSRKLYVPDTFMISTSSMFVDTLNALPFVSTYTSGWRAIRINLTKLSWTYERRLISLQSTLSKANSGLTRSVWWSKNTETYGNGPNWSWYFTTICRNIRSSRYS